MTVVREYEIETKADLEDLDLAQGAWDTLEELTDDEVETILQMVDEISEGTVTDEGYLSDFLWLERDTIAEWLGFNDFDEIMTRNKDVDDEEY